MKRRRRVTLRKPDESSFVPCSAFAKSHDPGHGPSHRQARTRPEPGAMALAQDFVGQSHEKPGQSHGFRPKPSQNITITDFNSRGIRYPESWAVVAALAVLPIHRRAAFKFLPLVDSPPCAYFKRPNAPLLPCTHACGIKARARVVDSDGFGYLPRCSTPRRALLWRPFC